MMEERKINRDLNELNRMFTKLKKSVAAFEETQLREKLHHKRALNLCQILLK